MKKVLFLLLVLILLLAVVSHGTFAYFSDTETLIDNSLTAAELVPVTLLGDGFEGDPWDVNWDDNGTTNWVQNDGQKHGGSYAALCDRDNNGYLTSDDLDASGTESIIISFWFNGKSLEVGDMVIQLYNGSTYETWYDLTDYPTYKNNVWCLFSEEITDPQYFISNFRLRFDGAGLVDKNEECNIDDVLVTVKQWP